MADLATLAALAKRWLYVNRGWRQMEWSAHCNTEDVRWTLRERGITLAGANPRRLVAEVPAEALRRKMPPLIESFLPDLFTWSELRHRVDAALRRGDLCRMLYTLDTGEIASKQASLEWAKDALDPAWRDLIQQAIDDRLLTWNHPPRAGSVEAAIAFAGYAKNAPSSRHRRTLFAGSQPPRGHLPRLGEAPLA